MAMVNKIKDFIYSFFVKHFVKNHRLEVGEYIKDMAEKKYRIEGKYYTTTLEPIYVVIDNDGQFRSFPQNSIEPAFED